MIIGIDASNIRDGGGVTHLVELLGEIRPSDYNFTSVYLWSNKKTLDKVEDKDWLVKCNPPVLEKGLIHRMYWQRFKLSDLARSKNCVLLFAPGGAYAGNFHPVVTMSRNLLPFEWKELFRYGFSSKMLKMIFLRITQSHSFQIADGLIFLTEYAKHAVTKVVSISDKKSTIIPHGINGRFFESPREQLPIKQYSKAKPFRLLYVSVIEMYKHQWNVAEAVMLLRNTGIPIVLDLVGPSYPPALKKLKIKLLMIDPKNEVINYHGPISHFDLHKKYAESNLCVFASSCENMPNILLEGMASGLPIACSELGPMPEVLGNAGVYFNPLDSNDIARAINTLIDSPKLRTELSQLSFERVKQFSWDRCAQETFRFFSKIVSQTRQNV
jgi:glycosyltransferase involved in cell wall biosynthesis